MATLSVYQKTSPNKDGTHSVILQINHDYKRKFITLFSIPADKWNTKQRRVRDTMAGAVNLNRIIDERISDLKSRIYQLQAKGEPYTIDDIIKVSADSLLKAVGDYRDLARREISEATYDKYTTVYRKLKDLGVGDIPLQAVGERWMNEFVATLRCQDNINSENTVRKYVEQIKRVLRYNKVTTTALSVSIAKKASPKVSLSRSEFEKLKGANLSGWTSLARDVFCLQVYLRGARIGDLLQLTHEHIKGDRVVYTSQKNDVDFDIKIIPEVQEIINKYKGQSVYILPVLKMRPADPDNNNEYRRHINSRNVVVNKYLNKAAGAVEINKHLSSHVARHTFALFMVDKGLDLKTMQNLLGHSSPSVTENYLRQVRKNDELDKAVDDLF